jgi:enterochelin esterase-like enzyme
MAAGSWRARSSPHGMARRKSRPSNSAPKISSPQIRRLDRAIRRKGGRAVRDFWERVEREGAPLIEKRRGSAHEYWATFLWRGDPRTQIVGLRSALAGDSASDNQLTRLPGSDVWYRTYSVRDDLRDVYRFAVNEPLRPARNDAEETVWEKKWKMDPFNPQRIRFPRDPEHPQDPVLDVRAVYSLLELPRAPRHRETSPRPGIVPGHTEEHRFRSRILKERRRIWVHVPSGVEPGQPGLRLAVFFDGFFYRSMMPTPTIVDNLVATRRIPPVLCIFIDQLWTAKERRRDLCQLSPPFGRFLVRELLPWVARTYRVRLRPDRTVLAGLSCGGLAALHWAAEHPERFGLVLSQSGSFWIGETPGGEPGTLIRRMMTRPKRRLRIYMDAGSLEGNYVMPAGTTLIASNRHMRDVLQLKGYRVTYREFSGGHRFQCWQETLVDGLVDLLGTARSKTQARRST